IKWTGQGWSSQKSGNSPVIQAPTNLRISKETATVRQIEWDWNGDPSSTDGFILYRSYSCPGQEAAVFWPKVIDMNVPWSVSSAWISLNHEPAGCVYKYQVSAYGRYGESAASNVLQGNTQSAYSTIGITFKTLKIVSLAGSPNSGPGEILISINGYDHRKALDWISAKTYTLADLNFNNTQPYNTFVKYPGSKESLTIGFQVNFINEKGYPTGVSCSAERIMTPAEWQSLSNQATFTISSPEGNCSAEIGLAVQPPTPMTSGKMPVPLVDLLIRKVYRIGPDVYAEVSNKKCGAGDLLPTKYLLTVGWGNWCDGESPFLDGFTEQWVWSGLECETNHFLGPETESEMSNFLYSSGDPPKCPRKYLIGISPGKDFDSPSYYDTDETNNDLVIDLIDIKTLP
nr:hypothetical protein [Anaerolineaceae bacterium]